MCINAKLTTYYRLYYQFARSSEENYFKLKRQSFFLSLSAIFIQIIGYIQSAKRRNVVRRHTDIGSHTI